MTKMKLDKNFVVVGCGGLGCYIIENLLRLNVKNITVCDADIFVDSNLNRQLYATPATLGALKVVAAKKRADELRYRGGFTAIAEHFSQASAEKILRNADIVIDALDNSASRLLLEDECAKKNIPIVHGAVGEWMYQVGVCLPGSGLMHKIYGDDHKDTHVPNYSFGVSLCASREVAEAVKLALGQKSSLENRLLVCDLEDNSTQIVDL
ncbi:MAG: ThiF family adenylyltransferase [Bacillota bacterium]|nr:ThiF family adenylyltransferase [Bacillota bacterium]